MTQLTAIDEQIVGKTCTIEHSRKGKFTMEVTAVGEIWVRGIVRDGRAAAMLAENIAEAGDTVTVRRDFIRRIEIID